MNIVGVILQIAKCQPAAPALIEAEREISYGELARLVRATAQHLVTLGVTPGQRVALCLKDGADHLIAMLAVAWMGGVAVPLDWRARPAECARFIDDLGIACTLTEAGAAPAGAAPPRAVD